MRQVSVHIIAYCFALFFTVQSMAQELPSLIESDYIPEKIDLVRKIDSLTTEVRTNNLYEKRAIRASQIKFMYESVFYNQSIKQSGQIIYNKRVDEYLNKVLNQIIQSNPEQIGHDVQISVLRSSVVNAFASDEGNLFITLGLLARLENEAQLAFVLSHELSHWVRKHGLEKVSEKVRILTKTNSETYFSNESKVLEIHAFSQEIELDADDLGFDFYHKAGYSAEQIGGVFDILALSALPMDTSSLTFNYPFTDIEIGKEYLDSNGEPFIQDEIESAESSFSTHPNLTLRRENVASKEVISKSSGGKIFIAASEDEFMAIRELADYSIGKFYLTDLQFYSAYCHNQRLHKKYQDRRSKINLMSSWLGMFTISSERLKDKYTNYYTTYNDGYVIKEYFKNAPKDLLKLGTFMSAWSLYLTDTTDEDYRDLVYLAMDIMRKNPKKSSSKSRRSKPMFDYHFIQDLFDYNDGLSEDLKQLQALWEKQDSGLVVRTIADFVLSKSLETNEHNLSEQGILFVNPSAFYIDQNTITQIDLAASLHHNKRYYTNLGKTLDKYDVNYKILSFEDSTRSNIDLVDQVFKSRLLIKQTGLLGKNSRKAPYNLLVSNSEIEDLSEKYQCRYIAYTGLQFTKSSFDDRKVISALKLYVASATFFGIPQVLSSLVYNHHNLSYYSLIYDTKTKKFIHSDVLREHNVPNNDIVVDQFTQFALYKMLYLNELNDEEDDI